MDVFSNSLEHNFSQTLFQLGIKKNSRIVMGVSGGADSLALAGLYANWAKDTRSNCRAIVIDHGLRANSVEDAFFAKVELEKLHLKSKIIKIDKTPPKGNIQNWARIERFKLLTLEARIFRGVLMLGHHLDDQIETLYMRLARNSGLVGLTGMKNERMYHSIKIIRPLLEQKKVELIAYCQDKNIRPTEDPSNEIMKFDRVRARKHLMSDKKLSREILQLGQNIEKIVDVFKKCCSFWCSEHIRFNPPLFASIPSIKFLTLPEKMKAHIFRQLLWQIGARTYPASNDSIKKGLLKIIARKKFTLAGCIVIVTEESIEVHSERGRKIEKPSRIVPNSPIIIDNRWLFKAKEPILLFQMSDERYKSLHQNERSNHFLNTWPYPARLCIPIIVDLDGGVIQPHIETKQKKYNVYQDQDDLSSKNNVSLTSLRNLPFWCE